MGMGDELGLLAPGYLADVWWWRATRPRTSGCCRTQPTSRYIIQGGQLHKAPARP